MSAELCSSGGTSVRLLRRTPSAATKGYTTQTKYDSREHNVNVYYKAMHLIA
jgi:hypothetical protein